MKVLLKEQIVIKLIATIVVLSFNKLYSQHKIEGKFCVNYGVQDISKCLILNKDNTFKLFKGKHLKNENVVSGKWQFKEDNLALIFDKTEHVKSYRISVSKQPIKKDSVQVLFNLTDSNNGPMLGSKIVLLPTQKEYLTNSNGEVELTFKKSEQLIYGYTEYIGYENSYFSFNLLENHKINIQLNPFTKKKHQESNILRNFDFKKKTFVTIDKSGKREKWNRKTIN
ncbi:conserved protein of unknown function [Tenacibaculum sp. 190130A14a]|uniref:Uncharacterized protein n=1 Tax=Tenacibaculum polynesiense TaxID=3137857 RepID=A0ABM9P8F8_9FLAO